MKATFVRNSVVCNIGLDSVVIFHWGAKEVRMIERLFGLPISVTQFSVSITQNSKMVRRITQYLFGKR